MPLRPACPRRHYAAAQAARQPHARGAAADAPSSAPAPAKAWPDNRVPVPVLALGAAAAAAPVAVSDNLLPSRPVSTPASGALRNAAGAAAAHSTPGPPRKGLQNGARGMRLAAGSPCEGGVGPGHGAHLAAVPAKRNGVNAETCNGLDGEDHDGHITELCNGRLDSARDHSSSGAGPDPKGDMYPGGMAYACLPSAPLGCAPAAALVGARAAPDEGEGLGLRALARGRDGLVQRGDSSMLDNMEAGWHGTPKGQGLPAGSGSACTCGGPGARCACGGPARGGCAGSAGAAPLQYKRLPVLTWWLETACALGGVLLLPLLSLTPCSTSAVRADAVSACSG